MPELYVIYTEDRKTKPSEISLSQEFFDGKKCCLDVKVKMIYDGKEAKEYSWSKSHFYFVDKPCCKYARNCL